MKNRPEELLQIQIVEYWNYVKNTLPKQTLLQSIRNENNQGGWRGARKGQIYKQMGRQAGFPDLMLLVEGGQTIFIELKAKERCVTKTGKLTKNIGLSPEQLATLKFLNTNGFKTHIMWKVEQFEKLLKTC